MQTPAVCSLEVWITNNGQTRALRVLDLDTSGSNQTIAMLDIAGVYGEISLAFTIAYGLDAQSVAQREENISIPEGES